MAKNKSLGGIIVDMILRDEKFVAGMRRAAKVTSLQVAKMRKDLNGLASSNITKLGALIGGAGIAAGIKVAVDSIDRLAKQADRLKLTTQSLAAFRHAAGLAGVDVENMEKSMAKMSRNVFEAATGNENLANTFDKLGLSADKLNRMSPEEQYNTITDALNRLKNANEKAAVAQEIFGKGGLEMMTMIEGGAAAIESARQEADLLGLSLSRVDAAKVELANDAMGRLQAAGEGFMQQVAVKLAPLIAEAGERIIAFIGKMGGMGKAAESVFSYIVKGAGQVGDVLRGWELIIAGLNVAWKGLKVAATAVIGGLMTSVQNALNAGIFFINGYIKAYNDLPFVKGKAKEIELFNFAGIDATIDATKDAILEYQNAQTEFGKVLDKGKPSDEWPKALEGISQKWEDLAKPIADASRAASVFEGITVTAAEKAEKSLKKTEKVIKDIKGELMSFSEIADKGGNSANARLAKRAGALRERADKAEARGNFGEADRLRARAENIESRVKRREIFTPEQSTAMLSQASVAIAPEAPKAPRDPSPGELGSIDNPYASYEDAMAAESAEKAAIAAEEKRKRDLAYNAINARMMPGTSATPESYDEINARMRRNFNDQLVKEEKMQDRALNNAAKAATESKKEEGPSLVDQISDLIKTLLELPNKLGVA